MVQEFAIEECQRYQGDKNWIPKCCGFPLGQNSLVPREEIESRMASLLVLIIFNGNGLMAFVFNSDTLSKISSIVSENMPTYYCECQKNILSSNALSSRRFEKGTIAQSKTQEDHFSFYFVTPTKGAWLCAFLKLLLIGANIRSQTTQG